MSYPQPSQPRGRARATARGRPPPQPQGRGAEVRRPGPPAGGPATNGLNRQAVPLQPAIAAGRGGPRRSADNLTEGVANLSIASTSTSSAVSGGGASQSLARGALRGRREINYDAELLHTRPEHRSLKQGAAGKSVKLLTNYFRLATTTNWCLYHYDVKFSHDEDRTAIRRALVRDRFRQQFGGYLFDGSSLFLSTRIPNDRLEFFATRTIDNEQIQVTVTFTNDLQPSDGHYVQVFNICMRNCLEKLNLTLIGRNYYDSGDARPFDRYNLTIWPGYATSIRQHEHEILMNADISCKVLRKDSALDVARSCMNSRTGNFKDNFASAMIGATVMTWYNDKFYKITDVDFNTTPKDTFETKGTRVTYMDFYQNRYNIRITDPNQPLLIAKSKAREVRAGVNEFIALIPELCKMTGYSDEQRANNQLKKDVSSITRMGPQARIQRLLDMNKRLKSNQESVQELRKWNMSLEQDLVKIDARILPATRFVLIDGTGQSYESGPRTDWTAGVRSRPMYKCESIKNWTVVVTGRAKQKTEAFVKYILQASSSMNFQISRPNFITISQGRTSEYVAAIDEILSSGPCDLIMTIFPTNAGDRYTAVKKKCYVDRAIASQVVLERSVSNEKNAFSIATKVAIQMNCKVGGAPWTLPVKIRGVMVIGFDVYHDPKSKAKSVGAMVASLHSQSDQHPTFSRYFSAVDFHRDGNELSGHWEANMSNALREYQASCGEIPKYIVIYRDGVGDGQIPQVKEVEVESVKRALSKCFTDGNKPQLLFIVVSKRTNTKLFTERGGNAEPGTVVDDVITFPHRYDFYLVSQSVGQGTVNPTSYNVIYDESTMTPDLVQNLSYALTHLYFNWSGTIRVPAPCQYAHKLAYMVGQTLREQPSRAMEKKNLLYFL